MYYISENRTVLSIVKKKEDGASNEILKIISEPWSMHDVVNEFKCFLTEILGEGLMQKVKTTQQFCYTELIERFKEQFYNATCDSTYDIKILIPISIIDSVEEEKKTNLTRLINASKYAERIKLRNEYMFWKSDDFLNQFGKKTLDRIIRLITSVFSSNLADVNTILLIGGLSECDYVKHAIRRKFVSKRVVFMSYVDVLKGAVYIGHMIH